MARRYPMTWYALRDRLVAMLRDVPGVTSAMLIDLRPLRRRVTARSTGAEAGLIRAVTGFDYLLVMSGSTAAGEFEHP